MTDNLGHYYQDWDKLSAEEQSSVRNLFSVDQLEEVRRILQVSSAQDHASAQADLAPLEEGDVALFPLNQDHEIAGALTDSGSPVYRELQHGLDLVAQGKVAVLCLAGGQGTRLGSSDPKGLFNIGLTSQKSLFQIQAERLKRLQVLASQHASSSDQKRNDIPWIILTSPATHAKTVSFFQAKSFFGLSEAQISFIQQGELPALTEDGKVILESRSQAAMAPNGNGGLYEALIKSGTLDKLETSGVEYIDTYCVDNVLARIGDPLFVGHVALSGGDVGSKVVAKAYPEERVGVFARQNSVINVVEYSELDPKLASAPRPGTSELYFNWSNISSFLFSPSFVRAAHKNLQQQGQYHLARKTIKSFDGPVQGIKLESFIFDPLPLAQKLVLMEVRRHSHFAPVKNANGAQNDTPDTAKQALLKMHQRWRKHWGESSMDEDLSASEVVDGTSYFGERIQD